MRQREVILCIGIPASGKSTWSRQFVQKNPNWVRVNRDDYRLMLKEAQILDNKGEQLVTKLVNDAILAALFAGYSVIVDQTNCREKYLNQLVDLVVKYANVSFRVFETSLEKAIERDNNRVGKVGENVIKKMYKNYQILVSNFDFRVREQQEHIYIENVNENDLDEAVIVDLDGTLAFANGKRDWYDSDVSTDDISEIVKEHVQYQYEKGKTIIIVTGRDNKAELSTREWLAKHDIPYHKLYMREFGDYRKDTIVKKEIYENYIKDNYFISVVYDDRKKVVNMWRSLGIKCFQVEWGEY